MGLRGPAPIPTPILAARGSKLAIYGRPKEPKPASEAPRCPKALTADARKVWHEVVPMLQRLGVLSRIDGRSLERYCETWVQWRRCRDFLEKYGTTYPLKTVKRDREGHVFSESVVFKEHRQVKQMYLAHTALLRLEQEFGMTPAARARIQVQPQADAAPVADKSRFFRHA